MADISKEQAVQLAREHQCGHEAMTLEWIMPDGFHEAVQAAYKLGCNAGMEEAKQIDWSVLMREGQLVTWGDAGTLAERVFTKLESLKDNTP